MYKVDIELGINTYEVAKTQTNPEPLFSFYFDQKSKLYF